MIHIYERDIKYRNNLESKLIELHEPYYSFEYHDQLIPKFLDDKNDLKGVILQHPISFLIHVEDIIEIYRSAGFNYPILVHYEESLGQQNYINLTKLNCIVSPKKYDNDHVLKYVHTLNKIRFDELMQ